MNVEDLSVGMTVDLTIRGAVVEEVDEQKRGGTKTYSVLCRMPGDKRHAQAAWLDVQNRIYGGDGVQLDAAYTREPLGRSIARDRHKTVWQRAGGTDEDGTWYSPSFGHWEGGALGWRTLWKENGPIEVLFDDTESEAARVKSESTTVMENEHNPA